MPAASDTAHFTDGFAIYATPLLSVGSLLDFSINMGCLWHQYKVQSVFTKLINQLTN